MSSASVSISSFPIWKTIVVEENLLVSEEEMRKAGIRTGGRMEDVFRGNVLSGKYRAEPNLALVVVTIENLGLVASQPIQSILARASSLGLNRCAVKDALRLRLQYGDQPADESLLVPVLPTNQFPNDQLVFFVRRSNGDRCIDGYLDNGFRHWFVGDKFVFVRVE